MLSQSVGVIIPFNQLHTSDLEKAVESVLAQTLPAQKILVVDNSINHCASKVEWGFNANPVDVVRMDPNVGASAARNYGAEFLSDFDFIAFLDSDDLWTPDKLAIQLGAMLEVNASSSVCQFTFMINDKPHKRPSGLNWFCGTSPYLRSHAGLGSVLMIKSSIFRQIGGFDPLLRRFEDWDFQIRLSEQSVDLLFIKRNLATVIRVPNSNWLNANVALSIFEKKYLKLTLRKRNEIKSGIFFEKAVISFREGSTLVSLKTLAKSSFYDIRQFIYLLVLSVERFNPLK